MIDDILFTLAKHRPLVQHLINEWELNQMINSYSARGVHKNLVSLQLCAVINQGSTRSIKSGQHFYRFTDHINNNCRI